MDEDNHDNNGQILNIHRRPTLEQIYPKTRANKKPEHFEEIVNREKPTKSQLKHLMHHRPKLILGK